MEKVNVTIRFEKDTLDFLDTLGKSLDRDRSYLIKQAVASFVTLHKWQIDEIHKAIAEAEAGEFATAEDADATFTDLTK